MKLIKFCKFKKLNLVKKREVKRAECLNKLSEGFKEIIKGNYSYELGDEWEENEPEIYSLFNKMIWEIKRNKDEIYGKNRYFEELLLKIEAVENIVLGVYTENEVETIIPSLLEAFTQESGLGYSRAMYFRYSRELDSFVGEKTSINSSVRVNTNGEFTNEFQFQLHEFKNLVRSIKVPFRSTNLIGKSLKEQKVLYFNDKGYKYDLGHDLFKGMGIQNFLVIPIYAKNRNFGCIIVDYFAKNRTISEKEFELIKLLAINISVRIGNKLFEEERVDSERENTIRKLTERFLGDREKYIENVYELTKGCRDGKKDLSGEIANVEILLKGLIKENQALKEYSELGLTKCEWLNLEDIFYEIKEDIKKKIKTSEVTISIFANFTGVIYGNRSDLKKAFYELIKNSYSALINSASQDKRINIIITKDKKIDKIRINIIDNGTGIKGDLLEKIYIPFLKIDGKVPGLGLSLVYRVIKEHQGVIKFFSKEDEGTDVKITLNAY